MNKRIWVTGASKGIGEAVARELVGRGNTVFLSARDEARLSELAAELGPLAHDYPVDITDQASVRSAIQSIETEHGSIDIAILNAGTHRPVDAVDFSRDGLEDLLRINVLGTAGCLEALLACMLPRGNGHIAVVASIAGYRGLPTSSYYGATKAALINLTESLKFDCDKAGIKLQLINPGFVRTPLTDKNEFEMPFLMEPNKAAVRVADGLDKDRFEVVFPKRFVFLLKFFRLLPYSLYFCLIHKSTGK